MISDRFRVKVRVEGGEGGEGDDAGVGRGGKNTHYYICAQAREELRCKMEEVRSKMDEALFRQDVCKGYARPSHKCIANAASL